MEAFKRVQEAIEEIQKGNMIIMLDDEDRENEGDLVCAAPLCTPEKVNFMASFAKGLICVPLSKKTADKLELTPMVNSNTSSYETAFTISVDAKDAATGISAFERNDAIKILANRISKPEDLVKPGHIFPLIAKDGGVLVRTGHTEGSVDLCKLAGFNGESVICEIMKDDGTMARRDDLDEFAKKYNLKQVFISDLVQYRLSHELLVEEISEEKITFFDTKVTKKEFKDHLGNIHTAIIFGNLKEETNVKFHRQQMDLELFIDNTKLNKTIAAIEYLKKNNGVFIFLKNGSVEKQYQKEYGIGAQILSLLKIKKINLLANSKNHSFVGLQGFGLKISKENIIN